MSIQLITKKLSLPTRRVLVILASFFVVGAIIAAGSWAAVSNPAPEVESGTLADAVQQVTDSSASGGKAVEFGVPQPLLGVYNGPNISDDDATKALFGRYPDIATTYYQYNQIGNIVSREEQRIDKGIRPLVTYTTKNSDDYLMDMANGSGPGYTALQDYVSALNTIANYANSKGLVVYATLDHEPDTKIVQGMWPADDTASVYAEALSRFITLCRSNAPKVITLYWYGNAQKTLIDEIGQDLTVLPDMYTFDPYSTTAHPGSETFDEIVDPGIQWLKARSWYNDQPIGITEFGSDHTDAEMAQFYSNLHQSMRDEGLAFAVFFNRNDPPAVVPLDNTNYPLSVAAFSASLGGD